MSPAWFKHIKLVDVMLLVLALAIAAGIVVQYIPEREPVPAVKVVDPPEVQERRKKVAPLLDAASEALEAGRMIEPLGESALHLYIQVSEIDPSHREAEQHSRQILQRYAELIRQDLNREAVEEANRKVQLLLAAAPESPLVQQLVDEVEKADEKGRARLNEITRLLVQAQQDRDAGRLVSPWGNDALSRFRRVQEIDPENKEARQGIESILEHYVEQANNSLARGNLKSAESHIENVERVDSAYPGLPKLRDKLEKARQPHIIVEPESVVRPDIEIINEMVDSYRAAFEARDITALHNMSVFEPGKEVFLQQMFSQFVQFRLDMSGVEYIPDEHKGIVRVALVDLIESGGDPLPMPGPWSRFEIVIQKNASGQWKVFWLMPNF